jgi:putative transposase
MNTNLNMEVFMKKNLKQQRWKVVQRFLNGEKPDEICAAIGRSRSWLYKWVTRYAPDNDQWFADQSRRPLSSPFRTPAEIEKIVEIVRLSPYNKGAFCGNQAIQWEMIDMEVQPIPSLSTIGRILRRRELTHRRTGRYIPKGKKYPELPALFPNQTHQVDLVGPCYLTGPIRFYSLNTVDTSINRCGI